LKNVAILGGLCFVAFHLRAAREIDRAAEDAVSRP